jgi:hypothetical protein
MFTSLTYAQTGKIYKEILRGVDKSIIKSTNGADNSITFINNSIIYFKSIVKPEGILGFAMMYFIVDESAMYDEIVFNQYIRPTLKAIGKKCIFLSTPRGTSNWFYTMYKLSSENERYKSYFINHEDNPYCNLEEVADAKKVLPDSIFRSEYLGEFVEGESIVFSNINSNINRKEVVYNNNEIYYAGIDLGRLNDKTVCTIVNKNNEVIDIYSSKDKPWETITNEVVELLNKYNAEALIEVNGIGDPVFETLSKKYNKCHPFQTNNTSKADLIESLIMEFQNFSISIPFNKELITELEVFEYNYSTKTRKIIYAARRGFHDDHVMSLALANKCRKLNKSTGVYSIM